MKIRYGGKYIILEEDSDWDLMLGHPDLRCTCGHHLNEHEFHFLPDDKRTIEVTHCLVSDHCTQFRRRGEASLNLGYA